MVRVPTQGVFRILISDSTHWWIFYGALRWNHLLSCDQYHKIASWNHQDNQDFRICGGAYLLLFADFVRIPSLYGYVLGQLS